MQIISSLLFEKKYKCLVWVAVKSFSTQGKLKKTVKNFICNNLIIWSLITNSCHCPLTNEMHLGLANCFLYQNFLFKLCFEQLVPPLAEAFKINELTLDLQASGHNTGCWVSTAAVCLLVGTGSTMVYKKKRERMWEDDDLVQSITACLQEGMRKIEDVRRQWLSAEYYCLSTRGNEKDRRWWLSAEYYCLSM